MATTNNNMNRADRDLLIELRTEMVSVKEAINNLNDTTKVTIADHEIRIRFIERYMWLAIGALAILEFALQIYTTYHK